MKLSKTKDLTFIKERISKILQKGTSRIRFTPQALAKIYEQEMINNQFIRSLLKDKLIKIIPKAERKYKIYMKQKRKLPLELQKKIAESKVPCKFKKTNSLKYLLKRKIVTDKDIWIKKVRQLRAELKTHKPHISKLEYRTLRQKIKGNKYKRVKDLLGESVLRYEKFKA